ncbi:MAG: L-serine ammonia-lyase, iron-sulfur-dependent, subunit alpha [Treponema sp.]|jgi:L-cysteine desulfidase|nr:L-serine ammonia-lyase, iron-sulfur-dependent, subunit alpha [Treponema sp.]
MKDYGFLLEEIKNSIQIATGCTEPAAIALNAAVARKHSPGTIKKVEIRMDMGLLKNAMFVGIPGVKGRGVELCAALGMIAGDPADAMDVLSRIRAEHEEEARALLPLISVVPREGCRELYIETVISTDRETTRVITYKTHDNIALVEHPPFSVFSPVDSDVPERLKEFSLEDMKDFADRVDREKIAFLEEGVAINRRVAEKGLELGFGRSLSELNRSDLWGDTLIPHVQMITGAASFARMTGVQLPVMIATGSGNQGITIFLTLAAAAEKLGASREKLLRGLCLAMGVNLLAKAYIGTLAPICACGVASGLGASVGIVYILNGTAGQMMGAVRSMIGGITGMICDGAKEGCANKVAISAATAALSAMTAVSNFSVSGDDGILAEDIHGVFRNMEYLAKKGMTDTNRVILDIMKNKPRKGC